ILLKHFGVRPFLWLGYLPIFNIAWGPRWAAPTWVFSFSMAGAIGYQAVLRCRTHAERNTHPAKQGGSEAVQTSEDAFSSEALQPSYAGHIHKHLTYVPIAVFVTFMGMYLCILLPEVVVLAIERNLHFSPISAPYIVPSMLLGHLETMLILTVAFIMTLYYVRSGKGIYGFIGLAVLELWWAIPRGYNHHWLYLKSIPFALGLVLVFTLCKERWRWAASAAVLFFISSLWLDAKAPNGFPDRYNPFTEPPYVEFLKGKQGFFRVMGGYGILYPNYSGAVNLQDVRYINALMIPAYQQYRLENLQEVFQNEEVAASSLWFTGRPERIIVVSDKTIGRYFKVVRRGVEKDIKANLPYYSLLGVRYILMPSQLDLNDAPPFEEGPDVPHLPLIYDNDIKIYENPCALPRSFITDDFEVVSSDDVRISPPGHQAASRQPATDMASDISRLSMGTATIEEYRPNKVSIEARLEHPGLLVLSDVYYHGWKAYVDDQPTKIFRVNQLLRGVFLREGNHRVEFRYRPESLTVGAAMGAIGLIAIVALLLPSRRYHKTGQ
ncbi:MAG: YfhO family protein, partial [Deltaproteobacteria bacterium]|nr:YfhO family protein [Deltaproteobacteria bacterium]